MCGRMVARGPDDEGVSLVAAERQWLALGSRRLAIVDLSPAGHQPMLDAQRDTVVVYNGMIYNFRELRDRLRGRGESFVSNCDTEVVLKAYGQFGHDCVKYLHGMFAFAIWDGRRRQLFLARDRLGIKPLYYTRARGQFLFASEVKALLRTRLLEKRLSPEGLTSYLAFGGVSEPLTAIEGVLQLPAGHTALLCDGQLKIDRYWEFPTSGQPGLNAEDAAEELRERLAETIREHLVSDAPLGVFLSGGLDSSVLAALAAREGGDVRSVSVSFDEESFDESAHAERVAAHIGAGHTDVRLRPHDFLEQLDGAFDAMDQPTMDGLNTYVLSQGAKRVGLTVAISGLGGDELFDGYAYTRLVRRLEKLRAIPHPLARPVGIMLRVAGGRAEKPAAWLAREAEPLTAYELLRRVFLPGAAKRILPLSHTTDFDGARRPDLGDIFNYVAVADLSNYTKNILLRDTDAMSMAHSLEVRVPFLDDRLVEWTLRLPASAKRGGSKQLLRSAAAPFLPPEILARPKQGFALPLPVWMRRELREDIDEKLARPPDPVAETLDAVAMTEVWHQYLRRGGRWTPAWSLYALCRWAETLSGPQRETA